MEEFIENFPISFLEDLIDIPELLAHAIKGLDLDDFFGGIKKINSVLSKLAPKDFTIVHKILYENPPTDPYIDENRDNSQSKLNNNYLKTYLTNKILTLLHHGTIYPLCNVKLFDINNIFSEPKYRLPIVWLKMGNILFWFENNYCEFVSQFTQFDYSTFSEQGARYSDFEKLMQNKYTLPIQECSNKTRLPKKYNIQRTLTSNDSVCTRKTNWYCDIRVKSREYYLLTYTKYDWRPSDTKILEEQKMICNNIWKECYVNSLKVIFRDLRYNTIQQQTENDNEACGCIFKHPICFKTCEEKLVFYSPTEDKLNEVYKNKQFQAEYIACISYFISRWIFNAVKMVQFNNRTKHPKLTCKACEPLIYARSNFVPAHLWTNYKPNKNDTSCCYMVSKTYCYYRDNQFNIIWAQCVLNRFSRNTDNYKMVCHMFSNSCSNDDTNVSDVLPIALINTTKGQSDFFDCSSKLALFRSHPIQFGQSTNSVNAINYKIVPKIIYNEITTFVKNNKKWEDSHDVMNEIDGDMTLQLIKEFGVLVPPIENLKTKGNGDLKRKLDWLKMTNIEDIPFILPTNMNFDNSKLGGTYEMLLKFKNNFYKKYSILENINNKNEPIKMLKSRLIVCLLLLDPIVEDENFSEKFLLEIKDNPNFDVNQNYVSVSSTLEEYIIPYLCDKDISINQMRRFGQNNTNSSSCLSEQTLPISVDIASSVQNVDKEEEEEEENDDESMDIDTTPNLMETITVPLSFKNKKTIIKLCKQFIQDGILLPYVSKTVRNDWFYILNNAPLFSFFTK